jgi:peptide-methionine (S)-S-oxide reductase
MMFKPFPQYFGLLLGLFLFACGSQAQTTDNNTTSSANPAAVEITELPTLAELDSRYADLGKAYFAGGCFWCTEAAFERIAGVKDVWSGYTGGPEEDPTYKEVSYGRTGHAEAIVVYYDPAQITYETLLDVFFTAHDPTQVNRQGPDVGPQYRTEIFYLNEKQREAAEEKIAALNAGDQYDQPIATQVTEAGPFYLAEAYHQNYYELNPNQPYVYNVSRPKVEKVMKKFADRLKPAYQQS